MPRPPVPVHYLRPNHAESTPPTLVVLDTETRVLADSDPEILALRLWCARLVDRRPMRSGKRAEATGRGRTAVGLADWLEAATVGRGTIWVYAHNLSFDLATTRLPLILAARGWEITDAAIGGKAPWLRMRRGSHRITLLDSWSWLGVALEQVGAAVDIPKLALPGEDDTDKAWFARCASDVDILTAALLELMGWWDRHKLGRWTISGASTGWNAMRHMPSPQKILIDPEPAGVTADRATIYGGRRGVWRVGQLHAGPFLELDFVGAYPTAAANLPLPVGRREHFRTMAVDDWRVDDDRWGIAAQVEIETDVPRWPVKIDGVVFYPVGRFRTALAGPDITEAARLGCLRAIGEGYVHQLGTAMMPWARWVLATQRGEIDDTPDVAKIAAKAWGRSVIGKWASRTFERTELGPSPVQGWGYEQGWDDKAQAHGGIVDIAGRRWWVHAGKDADNAYPGIYAWVEAQIRTRLSRVIEAIGAGCVIQCDTDGLIVAQRSIGTRAAGGHLRAPAGLPGPARLRWVLDQLDPVTAPLTLRVKRQVSHVTVIGPQHLDVGGQRRLSGIHSSAEQTGPNTYTGKTWPKLQWQMHHGDPRGYVRPEVTSVLTGPYVAGWVTTRGTVIPPAAAINAAGETVLLPWWRTPGRREGDRLTEGQHASLADLW